MTSLWTAPRTYTTAELVTAAIENTDHRDNLLAIAAGEKGVPEKGIIFFNDVAANIPTGWAEATGVRGRTVVGMPASGTVAGTVGTALTDRQDLQHRHTITHAHGLAENGTTDNTGANTAPVYKNEASNSELWQGGNSGGTAYAKVTSNTGDTNTANTGYVAITAGGGMPYVQFPAMEKSA